MPDQFVEHYRRVVARRAELEQWEERLKTEPYVEPCLALTREWLPPMAIVNAMVRTVEEAFGRQTVIRLVADRAGFFRQYNQAIRDRDGKPPFLRSDPGGGGSRGGECPPSLNKSASSRCPGAIEMPQCAPPYGRAGGGVSVRKGLIYLSGPLYEGHRTGEAQAGIPYQEGGRRGPDEARIAEDNWLVHIELDQAQRIADLWSDQPPAEPVGSLQDAQRVHEIGRRPLHLGTGG